MSVLGGIGHALKGVVHTVGKVAEEGAPLANLIPGVGPAAAAAIGGLGGLAAGDGITGGIKGALGGYIPGVAGLGSAATAGSGLGGVGAAIKGAVTSAPGLGAVSSILQHGGQAGTPGQAGGGGILQSIESLLTGNGGLNALGAAQGVNAAMLQKKANDYANNALGSVQQSYTERAPLRTAGIEGMLHPQAPSLAGLSQIASVGNPYAPKVPSVAPVAPMGQVAR